MSLLRVLELLRSKEYDRVVLDTAPTGHTLRLLALPELLDDFAERAAAARDRLKRNPLVGAALSSLSGGVDDSIEEARDRVRELQDDAFAMDAVLKNADRCEFVMVAAPTDLSLTETDDLKRSLDESGVKAKRLVVNGVLDEAACKNFRVVLSSDAAREPGGAGFAGAGVETDDSDGAAVRRGPRRAGWAEALGGGVI